ncbi:MAG TPA: hypothetical protein VIJ71_04180, partial [Mycobacteriales bacterium]
AAEAKTLSEAIPAATVTADSSVAQGAVVLTLGSSDVTIQSPSATSSAPSASTSSSEGTTNAAGSANAIDGVPCGP